MRVAHIVHHHWGMHHQLTNFRPEVDMEFSSSFGQIIFHFIIDVDIEAKFGRFFQFIEIQPMKRRKSVDKISIINRRRNFVIENLLIFDSKSTSNSIRKLVNFLFILKSTWKSHRNLVDFSSTQTSTWKSGRNGRSFLPSMCFVG